MAHPKQFALVVEDHPQTVYAVRPVLSKLQLEVKTVASVQEAVRKLEREQFDLIVIDRNLPDGDGLDVLEELQGSALPARVLVLSSRAQVEEKIAGFEAGADEYLPKPFSSDELHARVRALLRRGKILKQECLEFEGLRYYPAERVLLAGEAELRLSVLPAKMLELLLRSVTKTVSRSTLMNSLWPAEKYPQDASVDVLASRLRRAIAPSGITVKAKPGVGYCLVRLTL